VDLEKCTFCGDCAAICQYNALAVLLDKVMVFPELCHSCGGCFHICPEKAITEVPRKIGRVNSGQGQKMGFIEGRLDIGEALSPPVTKATKKLAPERSTVIIDAPPGTSCPVIEAVRDSNFVLLVSEPTPFGLNDLKLAVEMVRILQLPFGVVINRSDIGDNKTEEYCHGEKIDILLRVKDNRQIAESYSRGEMISAVNPDFKQSMTRLYREIADRVRI
jgi:MinD superfamily P-loop ATPase